MYLVNNRPDIAFVVNSLSLFMVEPKRLHWIVIKHVLHYLCCTIEYGIRYDRGEGIKLMGYTDAYWVGSTINKRNTLGCCFNLRLGVVFWFILLKFATSKFENKSKIQDFNLQDNN